MSVIDFTKKECTDVMEVYDDWTKYVAILNTMSARGLASNVPESEFAELANTLRKAKYAFSDLPLNEAYVRILADGADVQVPLLAKIDIDPVQKKISRCCGNTPPSKSMLDLLKTGGYAAAKWALSGFQLVSKDDQNKRLDACEVCEQLDFKDYRCRGCGCFVKIKAWMATEVCPQEKW